MSQKATFNPNTEKALTFFEQLKKEGKISPNSAQIIMNNLNPGNVDLTHGTRVERLGSDQPMAVLVGLDKTYSMDTHPIDPVTLQRAPQSFKEETIVGLKDLLKELQKAQRRDGTEIVLGVILWGSSRNVSGWLPFTPVDAIDETFFDSYQPTDSSTAIPTGAFMSLTGVAAYAAYLDKEGFRGGPRIFTMISDGDDNESNQPVKEADVKELITSLRKDNNFIFSFLGVGDDVRFRSLALRMGFLDKNVRSIAHGPGAIAKALQLISQSTKAHSQRFSQNLSVLSTDDSSEADFFIESDDDPFFS